MKKPFTRLKSTLLFWICFLYIGMPKNLGLNGGYYSAGLQQAHSTTPHEAPHSAGAHAPQSVPPPQAVAPPPVSAVSAAPPPGLPHGLVSKSVWINKHTHTQATTIILYIYIATTIDLLNYRSWSLTQMKLFHSRIAATECPRSEQSSCIQTGDIRSTLVFFHQNCLLITVRVQCVLNVFFFSQILNHKIQKCFAIVRQLIVVKHFQLIDAEWIFMIWIQNLIIQ